nr:MAG TPA: hypothetical protein [Caudoviricetes sp.]
MHHAPGAEGPPQSRQRPSASAGKIFIKILNTMLTIQLE